MDGAQGTLEVLNRERLHEAFHGGVGPADFVGVAGPVDAHFESLAGIDIAALKEGGQATGHAGDVKGVGERFEDFGLGPTVVEERVAVPGIERGESCGKIPIWPKKLAGSFIEKSCGKTESAVADVEDVALGEEIEILEESQVTELGRIGQLKILSGEGGEASEVREDFVQSVAADQENGTIEGWPDFAEPIAPPMDRDGVGETEEGQVEEIAPANVEADQGAAALANGLMSGEELTLEDGDGLEQRADEFLVGSQEARVHLEKPPQIKIGKPGLKGVVVDPAAFSAGEIFDIGNEFGDEVEQIFGLVRVFDGRGQVSGDGRVIEPEQRVAGPGRALGLGPAVEGSHAQENILQDLVAEAPEFAEGRHGQDGEVTWFLHFSSASV